MHQDAKTTEHASMFLRVIPTPMYFKMDVLASTNVSVMMMAAWDFREEISV
jgi:hypothetical protein